MVERDEKLSEEQLDELEDKYAVRSVHSSALRAILLFLRHVLRPIRRSPFSTLLLLVDAAGLGSLMLRLFTDAVLVGRLWQYAYMMRYGALCCGILGYYYDRNRKFLSITIFFYLLFWLSSLAVSLEVR